MERCTASFVLATSLNIFHLYEQYVVTNWLTLIHFCQLLGTRKINTVNPQKRPAGVILALRVQMRVLLEFGHFCLLFFEFTVGLIRIRVLFEGGSLSRIYGIL